MSGRLHRVPGVVVLLAALGLGVAATPAWADLGPGSTRLEVTVTVPRTADAPFTVDDAQFRWGLNTETGSAAYFGGCNFISAGAVGDTKGGRVWTAGDGHFRTRAGNVTVEKPHTSGGTTAYRPMSFADRCTDARGTALTTTGTASSGVQAVVDGGTGTVDPRRGTATIRWRGAFTVAFYGGLTYWWVSDPVLTLSGGRGQVTAVAEGFGTSREDMTKWERLPATPVVLAELSEVDLRGARGFATVPAYRGVTLRLPADAPPQARTGSDWGSFPQSFVDFQQRTGQAAYWYSSGGARDRFKPATTLYVSYDASARVPVTPPAPGAASPTDGPTPGSGTTAGGTDGPGSRQPGSAPTPATPASALPGVGLAQTLLAEAGRLVPAVVRAATGEPLLWAVAGLLALATGLVVAFRRGWLVWPRPSAQS